MTTQQAFRYTNAKPNVEDYLRLRVESGMGEKVFAHAETALKGSLFTACLYDGETLVAFGRVVGDGAISFVVNDIMVHPNYRRQGLGDQILNAIDEYFDEHAHADSYICLIANQPADKLYLKHKFTYLTSHKCGMLRKQD
jgi:GNAT superfamily N-acetyltransferase